MGASNQSSQVLSRRSFRLAVVVGSAIIAATTAVGVVFAAQLVSRPHQARAAKRASARPATPTPPSAREVERHFVGVNNAHAAQIKSRARIGNASCVQGNPGSYVCSFVRTVPPKPAVCAVAMLKWTPTGTSTYTVEQAGRVALPAAQCGPVQKVLHVLGTSG